MQPWLGQLAASYTAARRSVAGRCVAVKVEPLTQDQAQQALQPVPFPGAAAPPDVWIPESTTSVALLRTSTESARVLAVPTPSIATSPIVFAAPGDALRLLANPVDGSAPQLGDLVRLLQDPRGWGQPGLNHPEWGAIKVSTTNPGSTPLGAGVLLAVVGVLTQTPTPGGRRGRVPAPRGARGAARADPRVRGGGGDGGRAAGAGEAGDHGRGGDLLGRHPGRVRAGRLALRPGQPGDRAVAPAIRSTASSPPTIRTWCRTAAGSTPPTRPRPPTSATGCSRRPCRAGSTASGCAGPTASPGPAIAAGLRVDSVLPLAAVPQQAVDGPIAARTAWRLLTRRISLLGLFDVSGSMADPVPGSTRSKLDVARDAAQAALGFFDPQDSMGLWEFSRHLNGDLDYRVLVPLGPAGQRVGPFPNRQAASVAAYKAMVPRTATGLYDSILAAYRSATAAYRADSVNTVVVITDGRNEDVGSITLPAAGPAQRAAQPGEAGPHRHARVRDRGRPGDPRPGRQGDRRPAVLLTRPQLDQQGLRHRGRRPHRLSGRGRAPCPSPGRAHLGVARGPRVGVVDCAGAMTVVSAFRSRSYP